MSYPVYGRYQVAEARSALLDLHQAPIGETLKTVDHETPLGVLDQSDLLKQGIHASKFIPGCKKDPDALGSCTANAAMAELAAVLTEAQFVAFAKKIIHSTYAESAKSFADVIGAERAAIAFYHVCTDQTGNPGEEWPPTDCGSSGPYIVSEAKRLGVIHAAKIANGAENIVSLMQTGGVMMGSPWLYAWEEPDAHGFVDGDGSSATLERQIAEGVAGGHETRLAAIEKLVLLPTGHIDARKTIIRDRNSWAKSWGEDGCCRFHLSTLVAIGGQSDFRQLVK
jgi:hypothetical protein